MAKKRGQKPTRVKLTEDWKIAVGKALEKKRPADGWPVENKKIKPKK